MHTNPRVVVLVINASAEVMEVLVQRFRGEGIESVTARAADIRSGLTDLPAILMEQDPCAVVWDVALPYYGNWHYLQTLRRTGLFGDLPVVVTSPNTAALDRIIGEDTGAIELVGEAADLERVVAAVSMTPAGA